MIRFLFDCSRESLSVWYPFPRGHSLHFVPFGAGPVSLRLGHARVLTCHRHVIHYPRAASLPLWGRLSKVTHNGQSHKTDALHSLPAGEGNRVAVVGVLISPLFGIVCFALRQRRYGVAVIRLGFRASVWGPLPPLSRSPSPAGRLLKSTPKRTVPQAPSTTSWSPSLSEGGFAARIRLVRLSATGNLKEPSPTGKGARSGARTQ